MMNPETNRFEHLIENADPDKSPKNRHERRAEEAIQRKLNKAEYRDDYSGGGVTQLVRPNGSPVPEHWSVFKIGEEIVIKNYTFKVAYIGESAILFEPVGPVIVGENKSER